MTQMLNAIESALVAIVKVGKLNDDSGELADRQIVTSDSGKLQVISSAWLRRMAATTATSSASHD